MVNLTTVGPASRGAAELENLSSMVSDEVSGDVSSTVRMALVYTFVVTCFLATFANAYILSLARRISGSYSTVLKLTFGLAVADCWTSTVIGLSYTLYSTNSMTVCITLVIELFRMSSVFTSILHLLMMAVNHFQSINVQQTSSMIMSGRRLTVLMAASWMLPPAGFFVCFWSFRGDGFNALFNPVAGNQSADCSYNFMLDLSYRTGVYVALMLPVMAMIALYLFMMKALYALEKHFQKQNRRSRSVALKRKMLLTIILMVGSFMMGWAPSGTWLLMTAKESRLAAAIRNNKKLLFYVSYLVNFLMITKFIINPIIYALRIPEIHDVIRKPPSKARHSIVKSALQSHASMPTRSKASTRTKMLSVDHRIQGSSLCSDYDTDPMADMAMSRV